MTQLPTVADAAYDWSEVDLTRHARLARQAGGLLAAVRAHVDDLTAVLDEFAAAAGAAGCILFHERRDGALMWRIALAGPSYRASGSVELTIETPLRVSIVARPDGREPLQYDVLLGPDDDFGAALVTRFRSALVGSVLDAANVVIA